MRVVTRILAVVVLLAVALVVLGRYAPEGSFVADASHQFFKAIRMSWMVDPISS